jgi:hypothetical protein
MVLDRDLRREMGEHQWRPGFVDYLFLAFNISTAFSPTDVPVLSRWAKILMMLQAIISLGTIAILASPSSECTVASALSLKPRHPMVSPFKPPVKRH